MFTNSSKIKKIIFTTSKNFLKTNIVLLTILMFNLLLVSLFLIPMQVQSASYTCNICRKSNWSGISGNQTLYCKEQSFSEQCVDECSNLNGKCSDDDSAIPNLNTECMSHGGYCTSDDCSSQSVDSGLIGCPSGTYKRCCLPSTEEEEVTTVEEEEEVTTVEEEEEATTVEEEEEATTVEEEEEATTVEEEEEATTDTDDQVTPTGLFIKNPLGGINDVTTLVGSIINFLIILAIPITAILIVYAGYLYITSAGNEEKVKTAQKALIWAIIGFAIVLVASSVPTIIEKFLSGESTSTAPIIYEDPELPSGPGLPPDL